MERYALIVATDEYSHFAPTRFCHADAQLLEQTLLECDFAKQHITTLLLSPKESIEPSDLLGLIDKLVGSSKDGDTVLFYYAGHGDLHQSEPYIILPTTDPANKQHTGIALRDISARLRPEGKLSIRVFDTCHSGADVRDPSLDEGGFARAITTGREDGWITFAACRADEASHPDSAKGQGIFTWAFCEAIKEHAADKPIFPETVKLKACEKVSDWCAQKGVLQTPCFNSAISGNLHMAVRRTPVAIVRMDVTPTAIVDQIGGVDLGKRLGELRRFPKLGAEDHRKMLQDYISHAHQQLKAEEKRIECFSCPVSILAPSDASEIPEVFHHPIIRFVRDEGIQPLHEISEETRHHDENEAYASLTGALLGTRKRKPTITRTVSQPSSLPGSYTGVSIAGDGYLPSASVFCYLVPLKIRMVFLTGLVVAGTFKGGTPVYLDYGDTVKERITERISEVIDLFNGQYKNAAIEAVAYFDRELAKG